jgi:hypothetical protein
VACRNEKPMQSDYRDCSQPNMTNAMALPWVDAKP